VLPRLLCTVPPEVPRVSVVVRGRGRRSDSVAGRRLCTWGICNMTRTKPMVATAASLLVVSTFATPAFAETESASGVLPPVVVTPARTAQTVEESLSSVTVIEREEIERQQPKQFLDLLDGRAGVSADSSGPFGKQSALRLRGAESNHTVLLVDGVRVGSATTGAPAFQHLPPSAIERVEVVRGPRSSVYGADAIGGVVQIFTREGREGSPRINAFAGAGSFGTHEYGAGVAGGTRDTRYSLSGSHFHTDGINVQDDVGDDDDDGYYNSALNGKVSHRLPNGWEVFANAFRAEGKSEYDVDGFDSAHEDFVQQALRAGARGDVTPNWHTELSVAYARDEAEYFGERESDGRLDTKRDQLQWTNNFALASNIDWAVGLDWQEERVSSASPYDSGFDESSRWNQAAYSIITGTYGRHSLSGSLRYDDNQAFGSQNTGQLAWGYEFDEQLTGRVSYGTAFKAPTFNDLYSPWSANPDLDPEESETVELGLRYASAQAYWDIALFRTELDDLIVAPDFFAPPENVEEARITGLELEGGISLGAWDISAAGTFLDAENRTTGKELQRRPSQSLRLDVDRQLGDWTLGATGLARGSSYDDAANEQRIAGYGLLNLRASYAIDERWVVRGKVKNALDKEYETARGFNQPDRAVFVSIHYNQ